MKNVTLRMAWRNLWRHGRRTWLTVGAMIFSNTLLVFSISLQFGSYDMMIDNTLQAFSGHIQLQHPRYLDEPKMRYALTDVATEAQRLRDELGLDSISARAAGFALASSNERSYGLQILGVDAAHEPLVSTLPGLVKQGRYLKPGAYAEIVIGSGLARNLKVKRYKANPEDIISNLTDLHLDSPIVHIDHGVGRYLDGGGIPVDGVRGRGIGPVRQQLVVHVKFHPGDDFIIRGIGIGTDCH